MDERSKKALIDKVIKWMGTTIKDDTMDRAALADADELVRSKALEGATRDEVMKLLGIGERCGANRYTSNGEEHYTFQSFGFGPNDIYYSVGRIPMGWVGGVPTIIFGFDKDGRCSKIKVVHTQ